MHPDGYEDDEVMRDELENEDVADSSLAEFLDEREDFPFPPYDTPQTDEGKKTRFLEILRRISNDPLCSFTLPQCVYTVYPSIVTIECTIIL